MDFRAAALIHVAVKELLGIKSDVDLRERSWNTWSNSRNTSKGSSAARVGERGSWWSKQNHNTWNDGCMKHIGTMQIYWSLLYMNMPGPSRSFPPCAPLRRHVPYVRNVAWQKLGKPKWWPNTTWATPFVNKHVQDIQFKDWCSWWWLWQNEVTSNLSHTQSDANHVCVWVCLTSSKWCRVCAIVLRRPVGCSLSSAGVGHPILYPFRSKTLLFALNVWICLACFFDFRLGTSHRDYVVGLWLSALA